MAKPRISCAIGSVLTAAGGTLLIIIGYIIFTHSASGASMANRAMSTPQAVSRPHRLPEASASVHREQAAVLSETATKLNPWGIAIDSVHGFVWVAEPGCEPTPSCQSTFPGMIGKYALSDGSHIQDFQEPAEFTNPLFVTIDADGNVWFTQPNSDAIGELDINKTTWQQWRVKQGSMPYDLTFDQQGNLWFTEFQGSAIGFFNPQTQQLVENPTPTSESNPYGITRDHTGTIWFTENKSGVGQIGNFTPTSTGTVTMVEHSVPAVQPHLITSDRAGNIWFSEAFSGSIGEFVPSSGDSRSFPVSATQCSSMISCQGTHISGICTDANGRVWFDDSLGSQVGYLDPSSGQVVLKAVDKDGSHPHDGLAIDDHNTVWFTEEYGFELVKWPSGTVK